MYKKLLKLYLFSSEEQQGFTLIELLVVIVIISVLASIALPSYLNQAGKARGSEAKSNLAAINRSQQVYRLENNTMASNLTDLEVKTNGKFYTYSINRLNSNNANATAILDPSIATDLKNYSASVTQVSANGTQQEFFGNIICETVTNNTVPGVGSPPTSPNTLGVCPATMTAVD